MKLGLLYAILSIMTITYSWFDKKQKMPNYPPNHSSNWSNWIFWEFSCQCAPALAYVSLYLPLTASLSLEQAAEYSCYAFLHRSLVMYLIFDKLKVHKPKIRQSTIFYAWTLVRLYKWTSDQVSDVPRLVLFS